jgi:hypothetical protein
VRKRELKRRVAELESENARLREQVRRLTSPRREAYRARTDGPLVQPPIIVTAVNRSGSNGGE